MAVGPFQGPEKYKISEEQEHQKKKFLTCKYVDLSVHLIVEQRMGNINVKIATKNLFRSMDLNVTRRFTLEKGSYLANSVLKFYRCSSASFRPKDAEDQSFLSPGKTRSRKYECKSCKKEFISKKGFKYHQKIHTGEGLLPCKFCIRKFNQTSSLLRHVKIHTGEKSFTCEHCKRSFARKDTLIAHVRLHTREKPFSSSSHRKTGNGKYKCDDCKKEFISKYGFKCHQKIHTGEGLLPCKFCTRKFNQTSSLLRHVKIHTGEKLFTCEHCKRSFALKDTLIAHVRLHTREKPFSFLLGSVDVPVTGTNLPCIFCTRKFNNSSNLRHHVKIHTGEKAFTCDHCKRNFTKNKLIEHLRIHTGEKPFTCDYCKKCFARKITLIQHGGATAPLPPSGDALVMADNKNMDDTCIESRLIEFIQSHECLSDFNSSFYRRKDKKAQAWREISESLSIDLNPKKKSFSPSLTEGETSSKKKSLKSREEEEFAYLLEGENFNLEEDIRVLLRLHFSMNSKVDELISRLNYVSEWLKNLDEGLGDLDTRLEILEKLADKNCGLSDQSNVTRKFNDITREHDFLDNQRRINNVVISGLEEYDIIFLSETWYGSTNRNSDVTDCLQGYNLYFGKAFKLHTKGRYCAGWENDWQSIFETLTGLILHDRNVMIAGDFNARIGLGNIISDAFCSSFGIVCPLHRNSKDLVMIQPSTKRINLCDDLDLIIGNGRCLGDEAGEYSFISSRGCSVIDLIIVSPLIWKDILSLTMGQFLDSDHNPLILRVACGNDRSVSLEKRQRINRLFWDESRKDELRMALEEICISNRFDSMKDLSNLLFNLAYENGLKLNLNKSKIVVFRRGGKSARADKWWFKSSPIQVVSNYKYLGVTFSSNGLFHTHYINKRTHARLLMNKIIQLKRSAKLRNLRDYLHLLKTVVLPSLLYASEIWGFNLTNGDEKNELYQRWDKQAYISRTELIIRFHSQPDSTSMFYVGSSLRKTDNGKYKCESCKKEFISKCGFKRHQKIHTGEGLLPCKFCTRKFNNSSNLRHHVKIHTGEKAFTCDHCKRNFTQKQTLIRHLRIHTGEKPFTCGYCKRSFAHKYTLIQHVRLHTGERPFSCNYCIQKFASRSNLSSSYETS
ncbi:LOW QUALITY PROTEIN: zinc finger protein 721-like [Centruroides vittatus]|uniref:LOW QUALITY PROTEIN: zinc finger protein 721-like n=1 Tax=Centruroides vittatus TaxID=120091 RepID=UPI0035109DE4